MNLKLNARKVGDVTVVDAEGRITLEGGAAVSLRDTVRKLVAAGDKNVVLNLKDISYIDSSGIGELIASLSEVSRQGGAMKLLNLTKRVDDLLKITHTRPLFQVFSDEGAAVSSFS